MASTTKELVAELRKTLRTDKRDKILSNALSGRYHDFAEACFDTPKMQLVGDLLDAGLPELAARARNGEWDERPGEGL